MGRGTVPVACVFGCWLPVVGDLLPVAAVPVAFDPVGHRKRVCVTAFRAGVVVSPNVSVGCLSVVVCVGCVVQVKSFGVLLLGAS